MSISFGQQRPRKAFRKDPAVCILFSGQQGESMTWGDIQVFGRLASRYHDSYLDSGTLRQASVDTHRLGFYVCGSGRRRERASTITTTTTMKEG